VLASKTQIIFKHIFFLNEKARVCQISLIERRQKVQPGHPAAVKRGGGCGLVSNKKGRQTIGPCSNTEGDLGLDLIYH
jgi:hypothetical protein